MWQRQEAARTMSGALYVVWWGEVRRNRNEHPPSQCKPTFCCTPILQLQTICEIAHRQTITRFSSQIGMLHIPHLREDIFSCKAVKQAITKVEFSSKWNVVHNTKVAGWTYDTFFGSCMFQWNAPVPNLSNSSSPVHMFTLTVYSINTHRTSWKFY